MKQEVLVSVDFLRHLEAELSDYAEKIDGEWGNGRTVEQLDEAHLLPEEVYQIRNILKLREALAEQAEQEPVAWMFVNDDGECEEIGYGKDYLKGSEVMADFQPLFAAPVSIEAAVLAEREACAKVCDEQFQKYGCVADKCAAAIRARGEK